MNARRLWGAGVGLALVLAAGCASERPEDMVTAPPRPPRAPDPVAAAETPTPLVAPAERWRKQIQDTLPAGWSVGDPQDQIDAPGSWRRLGGDRGLRFELTSSNDLVTVTLMPEGFEGDSLELAQGFQAGKPTKLRAAPRAPAEDTLIENAFGPTSDGYIVFFSSTTAAWKTAEDDVAKALGASRFKP